MPESEIFIAVKGNKRMVTLTYETRKDLNNMTWAQIAAYAESGEAERMFEIGDTKDFTLTTGEKCKAVILDFNHDTITSNTGKTAGITFGMQNSLANEYKMNNTESNSGGYDGSIMFNTIVTEFYDKLPADMKPHIKKVRKKASLGNRILEIEEFDVFAFLFAEIEVTNTTTHSSEGEGTLYPYFATVENRIKTMGEEGDKGCWWFRSPSIKYNGSFCMIANDGLSIVSYAANVAWGLSAGFCM